MRLGDGLSVRRDCNVRLVKSLRLTTLRNLAVVAVDNHVPSATMGHTQRIPTFHPVSRRCRVWSSQ